MGRRRHVIRSLRGAIALYVSEGSVCVCVCEANGPLRRELDDRFLYLKKLEVEGKRWESFRLRYRAIKGNMGNLLRYADLSKYNNTV